jgi:hypothetical protein
MFEEMRAIEIEGKLLKILQIFYDLFNNWLT